MAGGLGGPEDGRALLRLGAARVFGKPFRLDEIAEGLRGLA